MALKHFGPFLRLCHVLVKTDSVATKYCLDKQGGLRSQRLDALARQVTLWCNERLTSVRTEHVPGLLSSGADLLSGWRCSYTDWSLHPEVVKEIRRRYGLPVAGLFAMEDNAKLPLFFAMKGRGTLGLDALANSWPQGLLYAFPPLHLIPPVLERVRTSGARVLLVAPGWGAWMSDIAPLLYDQPWALPLRRDLLRQARNEIFHPRPQDLDLRVWPVSASA